MKKGIRIVAIALALVLLFSSIPTETAQAAQSKTNWQIVKELARKTGKPIKLIKTNEMTDRQLEKIICHRKGKPYVLVEKVISKSDGTGYGWYNTKTKGTRYITGYNKRVKKGKQVVSYIIYDPKSNEPDEILWVVDNKAYRG